MGKKGQVCGFASEKKKKKNALAFRMIGV